MVVLLERVSQYCHSAVQNHAQHWWTCQDDRSLQVIMRARDEVVLATPMAHLFQPKMHSPKCLAGLVPFNFPSTACSWTTCGDGTFHKQIPIRLHQPPIVGSGAGRTSSPTAVDEASPVSVVWVTIPSSNALISRSSCLAKAMIASTKRSCSSSGAFCNECRSPRRDS
jgi:hypothetical protein